MEQKSTNTFLKSKMNKDLDERLVPNGEYRDAVNIAISKSEGSSVGAAENIQGTNRLKSVGKELSNLVAPGDDLEIIGQYVNEGTREIYLFLTNQGRLAPDNQILLDPQYYNPNKQHWVVSVNIAGPLAEITLYAGGPFLNFSTFYRINNINLLETQLFWTDNFNQPRSLDITLGIPITSFTTYAELPFNKEDQISVCTYSPYKAINLYKDSGGGDLVTTLQDAVSSNLPYITYVDIAKYAGGVGADEIELANVPTCVTPSEWAAGSLTVPDGLQCWTSDGQITQADHAYISAILGSVVTIAFRNGGAPSVYYDATGYVEGDAKLYVSLENPNWQSDSGETVYPGDQTFLEDRFARFSYRFKFRNGAYSTIAPYTQDCFIPKQYGYFLRGDEDAAYQSTVVSFMENMVNRILLQIMMPENESGNLVMVSDLLDTMGISEIDIIYKESNNASLQVVETLIEETLVNYWLQATPNATVVGVNTFAILKETIPVKLDHQRALLRPGGTLQNITVPFEATITNVVEDPLFPLVFTVTVDGGPWTFTIGDELIITQPAYEYDYQNNEPFKVLPEIQLTRIYDKVPVKALTQEIISNRITYANYQNKHTPPSTIDYQVGVSNKTIPGGLGTSNAYIAYPSHTVKQNRNYQVGFVLSDRYGRTSSVILSNNPNEISTFGADPSTDYGADTIFHPYKTLDDFDGIENFDNVLDWPGDSIKLLVNNIIESVKDANGTPGLYDGDDSSPKYNPLGWYSYKVVVKQKQQEYYNVYLPNIVNGLPQDFGFEPDVAGALITAMPDILQTVTTKNLNEQAAIVLINDNINKVPRDLTEVGPDQEQFRSSVRMWGRITPQLPLLAPFAPIQWSEYYSGVAPLQEPVLYNQQYYPDIVSDTVSTIATQNDFYKGYVYNATVGDFGGPGLEYKPGTEFPPIYNTETNPLVATVTTQKGIGNSGLTHPDTPPLNPGDGVPENEWPFILSVYETEPVESRLEIYWETSTSGLITDLNIAVEEGVVGIIDGIPNFDYDFKEDRDYAYVYNAGTAIPYWNQADNPLAPQGTIITPDLYFDDALGTPITTVYILDNEEFQWRVEDGNQVNVRWTPENTAGIFDIRRIPAGNQTANYEFSAVPHTETYDTFVVEIKNNSVYLDEATIRNFTFYIPAISQNVSGEWIQVDQSFQMALENVRPYWVIPTIPGNTYNFAENTFCPPGSTPPIPPCIENPPKFKAENGTVLPSPSRDAQLVYSIISITQNGQNLTVDPEQNPLFTLERQSEDITLPEYLIWQAVKNSTLIASGQYEITIRVQDANAEGLTLDDDQIWIFGDVPVNCSFLMETALPGTNSSVMPTINPTGDIGIGNGAGFTIGSQGGLIVWSSLRTLGVVDEYNTQLPNNFLGCNTSDFGNCFSVIPAPPGVPWVWLWGLNSDPACLLLPASQQLAGCVPLTLNVTEMTTACPACTDKDLSTTNSVDLSYGPSWCNDLPSGLTQGKAFITLKYTQLVNDADVVNDEGLIIDSSFRAWVQHRKEGPTTPWSDSGLPGALTALDIEGNEINSTQITPLNNPGLLSGDWRVSSSPVTRMQGGVLFWEGGSPPFPTTDPYPFEYWNSVPACGASNWFSTKSRVNGPAEGQFIIQISRTIAIEGIGGYRILMSALQGTLTSLTAAQTGSCSETYTNDKNCAITVEYGDFYYPHGTQSNFWRYEVSQEGSPTQVAAQNYDTGQLVVGQVNSPNMDIVYAREPFFRYITQFYTDQALTIPWTPQPGTGSWYMYRYATANQNNFTPGVNNVPLGNDGAAMSVSGDLPLGSGASDYNTGQRRWIAQFHGMSGLKVPQSSFPVTSYTE